MASKILYRTKFGKPILEGKKYVIVLKDNTILETIAREGEEDPNIVERFLTRTGADKFIKSLKKPEQFEKPVRNLEEEKISKLNVIEQLDYVNDQEGFNTWIKRNNITINKSGQNSGPGTLNLKQGKGTAYLIRFDWSTQGVRYCCGGMEMGSHAGSVDSNSSRYLTEERMRNLCKYIAKFFDEAMRQCGKNFGIVSYVKNPGSLGDASARIGFLLDASDLFIKGGRFKNPNTQNILDMYTISDKWKQN